MNKHLSQKVQDAQQFVDDIVAIPEELKAFLLTAEFGLPLGAALGYELARREAAERKTG